MRQVTGVFATIGLPVALLLALSTFGGQGVQAGFECHDDWSGPDENNQVTDCDLQNLYIARTARLISFGVPLLMLIGTILCYPLIFVSRQCCKCCGSNRRRPGTCCCGGSEWDDQPAEVKEAEYTYGEVQRTKSCTGILWLIGMACLCLMVLGGSIMGDAYENLWTEVFGLFDWADAQVLNIRSTVTVNQTSGEGALIPGVPQSVFDNATAELDKIRVDMQGNRDSIEGYADQAFLVAFGVGVGPVLLLILGALMATCDIRSCMPAGLTCCFFLFIIIYSILAVVFFVLSMVVSDVCDEIDLHFQREAGVVQWWVVPTCNSTLTGNLDQIKGQIADAETQNAVATCNTLLDVCSNDPNYNAILSPDIVYYCPGLSIAELDCRNFTSLQSIYSNTVPKTGTPSQCYNYSNADCNPANCSVDCRDPTLRQSSADALLGFDYAERALTAFNTYVLPLVDCNNLIDVMLRTFSRCRDLSKALLLVGLGATIYSFVFICSIWTMMRGQKRFFKKKDPNAGRKKGDDDDDDEPFDELEATTTSQSRRSSHRRSRSPSRRSRTPQ